MENELDEKEQLQVMCQRLKDEVRGMVDVSMYHSLHTMLCYTDLRQDMNTQTRKPNNESPEAVRTEVAAQLVTRHSTPTAGKYDKCYVIIVTLPWQQLH